MTEYKLKFYSIKKCKDELIHISKRKDFYKLANQLLGRTYIKDLQGFHYDKVNHVYKEVKL